MSLVGLALSLIVIGVLLWLVNKYVPMDAKIKQVLNITVLVATVLWVLAQFGLLDYINSIHVGKR